MKQNTVLITGATGFIGSHLIQYLLARHYWVIGLTRRTNPPFQHKNLVWIQHLHQLEPLQIDYVINLAGENIAQKRWTKCRKQQLLDSRIDATHALYLYLEQHKIYPIRFISGSAVGYYGIDTTEQWQASCDEQSKGQAIFMSELCQYWELSALSFSKQKTKIIRMGVVLAADGGILKQMLIPIKMNLFGRISHGLQPLVWVHIQDVLGAIELLMHSESTQKIYNLVAPSQNTQQDFAQLAAQLLKRKPRMELPAWLLKLLLGEQSQLILNGQFVHAKALETEGYQFQYPQLFGALKQLLNPNP